MSNFMRSNSRSGFSLLELLLVVGVGAVLILAGLSAYKLVSDNNAANQGVRQLQTMKTQVQQAFQGESNYQNGGEDLVTTMFRMRMLPPDMAPNNTTNPTFVRNGFGGQTSVRVGSPNTTFTIEFTGVSRTGCSRMALAYSTANTADFVGVSINGQASIAIPTVTNVSTGCSQDTNTLAYTFR